jgi:hypothetical protein
MGFKMSSLRKYGIIETVGNGEIRISDDANVVYIFPPDAPEHVAALKKLAMRPAIFGEVLKAFPDGLPSDQSLRAKLMLNFGFVSAEAADAFIRTLKVALAVGPSVGAPAPAAVHDAGAPGEKREETPAPQTGTSKAPPFVASSSKRETHAWKLGNDLWAEITINGTLTAKGLAKLKGYVALLDAEDDSDGTGADQP